MQWVRHEVAMGINAWMDGLLYVRTATDVGI